MDRLHGYELLLKCLVWSNDLVINTLRVSPWATRCDPTAGDCSSSTSALAFARPLGSHGTFSQWKSLLKVKHKPLSFQPRLPPL